MLAYVIHLARLNGAVGCGHEHTNSRSSYFTAHAPGFGLGLCHASALITCGFVWISTSFVNYCYCCYCLLAYRKPFVAQGDRVREQLTYKSD